MYLLNSVLFDISSDLPLNKRYSSYKEGMCVYMKCLLIFLSFSPKSKRMRLSLSCLFLQYYSFFSLLIVSMKEESISGLNVNKKPSHFCNTNIFTHGVGS